MKIRLSTTLEVKLRRGAKLDDVIAALREAFQEVGSRTPSMTGYMVGVPAHLDQRADISVGIQLEDVKPAHAEDFAEELLNEVLAIATGGRPNQAEKSELTKRDSSVLSFA